MVVLRAGVRPSRLEANANATSSASATAPVVESSMFDGMPDGGSVGLSSKWPT
jgi:hypothetical protein